MNRSNLFWLATAGLLLLAPAAEARQCARVTPPGTFAVAPCPPTVGRASPAARRAFQGRRDGRRGRSTHRRHLQLQGQTDNDGRVIHAWAAPSRAGRAGRYGDAPRANSHQRGSLRMEGVLGTLAAKASEIVGACGSRVISAVRHTRVAGSGRMSLHASGRAVDLVGNPGCIYRHLAGWSGGYSTDYGRVRHVHISLGGREDGLRFRHGGGRKTRLARR